MDLARLRAWTLAIAGMVAAVWTVTGLASQGRELTLLQVDVRALPLTSYSGPGFAPAPLTLQVLRDARRDLFPGTLVTAVPAPGRWANPSASSSSTPRSGPSAGAAPTPTATPSPKPTPAPTPQPTPSASPSILPSIAPSVLPSILPTPLATTLPRL